MKFTVYETMEVYNRADQFIIIAKKDFKPELHTLDKGVWPKSKSSKSTGSETARSNSSRIGEKKRTEPGKILSRKTVPVKPVEHVEASRKVKKEVKKTRTRIKN